MHFATLSSLLLLAISVPLAFAHPFKDDGLEGRDSSSSPGLKNLVNGIVSHGSTPAAGAPSNQRGNTSNDKLFRRDFADATIIKRLHDVEEAIDDTAKTIQNSILTVRDDTPGPLPNGAPPIKPDDVKNTISQVVKDPTSVTNTIKDHLADALPHDAQPGAAPPPTKRCFWSVIHRLFRTPKPAQCDSSNRRDGTSDPNLTDEYLQKLKDIKDSVLVPKN
ncbi:hypothetical protein K443DRAFT_474946 [Laccaria amethystina LaAM-08-1]|uniref:Uncharacterized protein n=1 Tax=Laccaria amethystina LaAM-08-1 TaxID=1095629 RepID=A0A0C9X209_9AGAR|nr:hypothetical protein K443DRAFT_474946 [Laccaria amethystina LaAM-08-1]